MIPKMQYSDTRVLLVEHQAQTASLYRFALDEMGFGQLICVTNTEEALDQMYFNAPGLIILGEALQPMSAEDFIGQIRSGQTGAPSDAAIVAIAEETARQALEKAGTDGVLVFLPAPASMEALCGHAAQALKKHRQQMEANAAAGRRRRVHQRKSQHI